MQLIQTAGPPQVGPIAKGLCGPGLLAHVITAKFADHIPLHRLAEQVSRSGVKIACSTLGGWLARAADLLEPLYKLMKQRVLCSRMIHSDDTGVKLRVEGKDKTAKAHLWAYIGDADYPYVVYDFTADYSGEGPQTFLKGYKDYGANARAADSLLKLAMSLDRLGQADAACSSFSELSTRFPDAPDNVKSRAKTEKSRIGCH